jgi:hypothetical protein
MQWPTLREASRDKDEEDKAGIRDTDSSEVDPPPVNGRGIRLRLLDPEERPLAIAKSPQIRMITFALVG